MQSNNTGDRTLLESGTLRVCVFLFTVVLLTVGALAGATDVFSEQVHTFTGKLLSERATAAAPELLNLLIAVVLFNIVFLCYSPMVKALRRLLNKTPGSERGKGLALKAFRLIYWGVAVAAIGSLFAQELMSKLVLGVSVFGAALTLSMQGVANDFICGVMMQFTRRLNDGDGVEVIGIEGASGKVIDVGYLETVIEAGERRISIPNRKIWENALVHTKSVSPVILPSQEGDSQTRNS
jgi:small-conductance mechanosensitive channel